MAATSQEAVLQELEQRTDQIARGAPEQSGPVWGAVHKLLLKTSADPSEVARLVATRDAEGLQRLLRSLRGTEEAPEAPESDSAGSAPADVDPETLKAAMRAFRRRLKLIRLDHESRLGVGPMTGGRKADFDAILPPQEYPAEVWEALVASGQLRRAGQGFYMLADAD